MCGGVPKKKKKVKKPELDEENGSNELPDPLPEDNADENGKSKATSRNGKSVKQKAPTKPSSKILKVAELDLIPLKSTLSSYSPSTINDIPEGSVQTIRLPDHGRPQPLPDAGHFEWKGHNTIDAMMTDIKSKISDKKVAKSKLTADEPPKTPPMSEAPKSKKKSPVVKDQGKMRSPKAKQADGKPKSAKQTGPPPKSAKKAAQTKASKAASPASPQANSKQRKVKSTLELPPPSQIRSKSALPPKSTIGPGVVRKRSQIDAKANSKIRPATTLSDLLNSGSAGSGKVQSILTDQKPVGSTQTTASDMQGMPASSLDSSGRGLPAVKTSMEASSGKGGNMETSVNVTADGRGTAWIGQGNEYSQVVEFTTTNEESVAPIIIQKEVAKKSNTKNQQKSQDLPPP